MSIQSTEIMTTDSLINWLRVLNDGYAKPDLTKSVTGTGTGTVRETKNFMPFIMAINSRLCELSGVDCPEITEILKNNNKNER